MKSTVKVKITLEDVCDSKSKFEKDLYVVFLDEDVRICSNVVTVKAVSQDLVQGGEIFYSIVSGNDPLTFVIQKNGVIVTKRLLDYETKPEYILIESRIIKSKSPLEDDISNLKLWVAVYKNDRFSFYSPLYVRDMVYINMVQISKMAKVTLLPFKDGLCVEEICNFPLVTSRKSCLSHTDYTDKSNT